MVDTSLRTQLLIVPAAHVRIFHLPFQVEMYALFHRRWICRVGHVICTPLAVTGLLSLLARVHVGRLDLGVFAAMLLLALYTIFDRRVGALLAIPLAFAWLAGRALAAEPAWMAVLLSVSAAALQALSHVAEDMPPPWSRGFRPVSEFFRAASIGTLARVSSLTVVAFFLELWASPRVWPLQVHALLLRLEGGAPRDALSRRVRAHLEAAEAHWPPTP